MQIIRKKYIIKAVSVFLALITVIAGIFLYEHKSEKEAEKNTGAERMAELTNLCAAVNALTSSFEAADELNRFSEESKELYGQCREIKSLLFNLFTFPENTAKWFSDLTSYTATDMTDPQKNSDYLAKLKKASELMINECSNFKGEKSLNAIEEYFTEKKEKDYYNKKLNELNKQYKLLENQITAERKEVTEYVKELLRSPVAPGIFKGSYTAPKSVSYASFNSYADIFTSGKFLGRMGAETEERSAKGTEQDCEGAGIEYLKKYASYADKCVMVYKHGNENAVYFIFCPVISVNNTDVINYNEPIKIAVSTDGLQLKAFDSTQYLKNHIHRDPGYITDKTRTEPLKINTAEITDQKTVLVGNTIYSEYKIQTKNKIYFILSSDEKPKEETFYFRSLGII